MQSQKHGGKFSEQDIYVAGPSRLSLDEDDVGSDTESIKSDKKSVPVPAILTWISESSEDEEPMLIDLVAKNGIVPNVNTNVVFPIDLKDIKQEYTYPSILDLAIKKEPRREMAEGTEPMIVTDDELQRELEMSTLQIPIRVEPIEGDAKQSESQLFEGMTHEYDAKMLGKEKSDLKGKPYDVSEKIKKTNVELDLQLEDFKRKLKSERQEKIQKKQEALERKEKKKKLEEEGKKRKLEEEEKRKIWEEQERRRISEEEENQTYEKQKINLAEQLRTINVEKSTSDNIPEMEHFDSSLFDDTMLQSQVEISSNEVNNDDTVPMEIVLRKPSHDTPSFQQTETIKMEHFYYTKEDGYKRYRDMIGLEIRRRKYVDMFKGQKTLLVKRSNTGDELINSYKIETPTTDADKAIPILTAILIQCMLKPIDNKFWEVK